MGWTASSGSIQVKYQGKQFADNSKSAQTAASSPATGGKRRNRSEPTVITNADIAARAAGVNSPPAR
jgi:hypothetical protein